MNTTIGTAPFIPFPDAEDLAQLRRTPAALTELIAGQPATALRSRPAPGEWCAAELVGHLLDNERVYRVERFAAILAANGAMFGGYDQDAMVRDGGYANADPAETLAAFAAARADTLTLLDTLDPGQWQRTGTRPERGTFTLAGVASLLAAHDRLHLAQIAATLQEARTP